MNEKPGSKARLVFVSHSSSDTWIAKQIAREIEARGGTVFLDEAEVDAGADFEEEILKYLERAHELVVLLYAMGSGPTVYLGGDRSGLGTPNPDCCFTAWYHGGGTAGDAGLTYAT